MYGKVFESIYDGTLAGHWEAIVTMQQLVVLANADGVVDMTADAIARRTTIPLRIIAKGLEFLMLPDPYTRTPGDDGKRIVKLDEHRPWGWRLVNHGKYKRLRNMEEKREADRDRQSEKRNKNKDVASESQKSPSVAKVAHADADAKAVETHARGARLSLSELPDDWREFCERERPDLRPIETFNRFKDYWTAKPGKDGTKLDWQATWRNWVRNEKQGAARALYSRDGVM